jgi:hypothetical protein
MKYRKKPVIVEAIQWTGTNPNEIIEFCNKEREVAGFTRVGGRLVISTLEGRMNASIGDYIIRGVEGEFYPCKPDIFDETYESMEHPCSTCFYYDTDDEECGFFGKLLASDLNPDDNCEWWLRKDDPDEI